MVCNVSAASAAHAFRLDTTVTDDCAANLEDSIFYEPCVNPTYGGPSSCVGLLFLRLILVRKTGL